MNRKKVLRIVLIALGAMLLLMIIGKKAGWFGKNMLPRVSTQKAARRTIVEVITANGKVQPETEVLISPDVSGEIVELYIKEGDEVKEGQLLLKIKPDTYQSFLEQMEAALNTAKANLASSRARLLQMEAQYKQVEQDYNRKKKLWEEKAISDAEYESSQATWEMTRAEMLSAEETVNAARYNVNSATASLKEARENLNKTLIYAPMSGTISQLNVEKGERVVGTMQMPGTEILRIANLSVMEVMVDVNENDIVNVKQGDTALIEIDAYIDQKFKGIVTEIAHSANTVAGTGFTDQVTNFEVKVRILSESYKHLIPPDAPNFYPFRPGMSATVDILTETRNNVIAVPIQAITVRTDSAGNPGEEGNNLEPEEGGDASFKHVSELERKELAPKEVVFVLNGNKVLMKEVKTGIQDNDYIEVMSGIAEGDEVVSAPYNVISRQLKDGMEVQKVEQDKLFEEISKE